MNTAPAGKLILLTYKDASPQAVQGSPMDLPHAVAAGLAGAIPAGPQDCGEVMDMGLCGSAPFGELCMTTCVPLTYAQVAGQTKGFHARFSTTEMEAASFDLNAAAGAYLNLLNSTAMTCKDVCTGGKGMEQAVATAFPEVTWKTIQALCPDACNTRPKTYKKEEVYYLPADPE